MSAFYSKQLKAQESILQSNMHLEEGNGYTGTSPSKGRLQRKACWNIMSFGTMSRERCCCKMGGRRIWMENSWGERPAFPEKQLFCEKWWIWSTPATSKSLPGPMQHGKKLQGD